MATLKRPRQDDSIALSSSPGFGTPIHAIPPTQAARPPPRPAFKPGIPTVLPILLPPPTVRPLAFRVFTKKYNLTLNSSALQALATFIGRHCGSGWREEGTGERVLEEVAKLWKAESGPVIVEDSGRLKGILKTLEGCMSGGKIGQGRMVPSSRQSSFTFANDSAVDLDLDGETRPSLERQGSSFGMSALTVEGNTSEDERESSDEPRSWLKIISAFQQPRLSYDADRKHFVQISTRPSLFPSPTHKIALFKERYNIILQRLLRNEAFQAPTVSTAPSRLLRQDSATAQQFYKITPIANLLGRGGSSHLLLGMLVIAPTGTLALNDLSGSISLDLQHATSLQGEDSAYFCPGMIVLVDGVYEEDWAGAGSSGLGNTGGVGGTIGGRFVGFSIGGPPIEKRTISLGADLSGSDVGGGFGWTDFLGSGSERAVGERMKRIESRILGPQSTAVGSGRSRVVILGDVTLDQPTSISGLRQVLEAYTPSEERDTGEKRSAPMCFILCGNFCSQPPLAGAGTGSIEYKELFDSLAAVLADFPSLLRSSTFVFVPGDNDPWNSSFTAGASTLLPRDEVPEIFTSRIRRVFANARIDGQPKKDNEVEGEVTWTSNPTRLSLFGSRHEIVVFRDDMSGRMRRNAVRIGQSAKQDGIVDTTQDADVTMAGALVSVEDESDNIAKAPVRSRPDADSYAIQQAKKLILSLLPQSTLSPFPLQTRPVHWDFGSALSLYPLPNTLVLCDAELEPFALTYEGCHVLNPGRFISGAGRRRKARWVEYEGWSKRGSIREEWVR